MAVAFAVSINLIKNNPVFYFFPLTFNRGSANVNVIDIGKNVNSQGRDGESRNTGSLASRGRWEPGTEGFLKRTPEPCAKRR